MDRSLLGWQICTSFNNPMTKTHPSIKYLPLHICCYLWSKSQGPILVEEIIEWQGSLNNRFLMYKWEKFSILWDNKMFLKDLLLLAKGNLSVVGQNPWLIGCSIPGFNAVHSNKSINWGLGPYEFAATVLCQPQFTRKAGRPATELPASLPGQRRSCQL